MPHIHAIRLRGPWHCEPLVRFVRRSDGSMAEEHENLPISSNLRMPADWEPTLGSDFCGRVRCRRSFGRPTGLEPDDIVWLVIDGAKDLAKVSLNATRLGEVLGAMPGRFAVGPLLMDRNELVVEVEKHPGERGGAASPPGGILGEVRLEIEPQDAT